MSSFSVFKKTFFFIFLSLSTLLNVGNLHAACPTITLTPGTLPDGITGATYSQTLTASGSTATPYTFSVSSGSLPPGLVLSVTSPTCKISGTPTAAGVYSFTIMVTDSTTPTPCTDSYPYTITVNCPEISISTLSPLPPATAGSPYSESISVSGGSTPYTFSVTSGSLPPGILLNPLTGVLSGTPTIAGTYSFVITVTDVNGCMASMTYSLSVNCFTITTTTLATGETNFPYTQTINVSGGVAPLKFSVTGGSLPPGLLLNAITGVISGTPSAAGVYNFNITATDSVGCTASMTYSLIVDCPTITFNTSSPLTSGQTGASYSQQISVSGDAAPYTFSVISGHLPPGLILNPLTGLISGVPTLAGTYQFTLQVTDSDGCSAAMNYLLLINCPSMSITPTTSSLAAGSVGTPYSPITITATGGVAPYTYAVTSGSLPPGLLLNPLTGVISGIPTLEGIYSFVVTATDSDGCTVAMTYTIIVNCPTMSITPSSSALPAGTVGTSYTPTTISALQGYYPIHIV